NRVINPHHSMRHIKYCFRYLRTHDIAVVSIGSSHENCCALDTGKLEDILVDSGTNDGVSAKLAWQPLKCGSHPVDNSDVVTILVEERCYPRPDPATTHDYSLHSISNSNSRRSESDMAPRKTTTSH